MIQPMYWTLIILVFVLVLIVQGKFRADLIALVALVTLGLTGMLSIEELLGGFANPVVISLAALFIVSAGIVNSGLVDYVGNYILRMEKGEETKLFILVFIIGGFLSGFLIGPGAVVVLLPIVMSMALKQKVSPSRLLLPLAYATSLGAILTSIGTIPNLYASHILEEHGIGKLTFFDFTPIGLIAFIAGILFMLTLGRMMLPDKTLVAKNSVKGLSAGELAGIYKVYDRLHYVHISTGSDIVGERLTDLQLPDKYEITIIEIKRKIKEKQLSFSKQQTISAKANEILHPDDIILVFGELKNVGRFIRDYELETKDFSSEDLKKQLISHNFGLTEILIMPHSMYENRTLVEIHFREKYRCNVLAINRNGEYIQTDIGTEKLKPGDALLIHGKWEDIERISTDVEEVLVIGTATEETEKPKFKYKPFVALAITLLMIILLNFESIPVVLSITVAALLMLITGCVRATEDAYQKINWEPIILIASLLGIMKGLENHGAVQVLSDYFVSFFENTGPYGLLAGYYFISLLLSQFIPYGMAAFILIPIGLASAISVGISPIPIVIGIAIAAGLSLASPKITSINAIVMSAGEYKMKDFILLGIYIQVFIGLVLMVMIPELFPFVL